MAEQWHIIQGGQRPVTTLAPTGAGFVEVIEITYMIDAGPATGSTFTTRIPAAMYTPENVAKTINGEVYNHNAIAGL